MSVSLKPVSDLSCAKTTSYDDDRWPSGSGGGLVTKKYPEHRGKHILFTPRLYGQGVLDGYVKIDLYSSSIDAIQ